MKTTLRQLTINALIKEYNEYCQKLNTELLNDLLNMLEEQKALENQEGKDLIDNVILELKNL